MEPGPLFWDVCPGINGKAAAVGAGLWEKAEYFSLLDINSKVSFGASKWPWAYFSRWNVFSVVTWAGSLVEAPGLCTGHSPPEVLAGVRLSFFPVVCLQSFLLCYSGLTNQMSVWHQPFVFFACFKTVVFFFTRSCGFVALQSYERVCPVLLEEPNWAGLAWCRFSVLGRDGVDPAGSAQWPATSCAFPWWAIARLSGIQGSWWT